MPKSHFEFTEGDTAFYADHLRRVIVEVRVEYVWRRGDVNYKIVGVGMPFEEYVLPDALHRTLDDAVQWYKVTFGMEVAKTR